MAEFASSSFKLRIVCVPVLVARTLGGHSAVKGGLQVGDRVIVFPSRELSDGARVVNEDSR